MSRNKKRKDRAPTRIYHEQALAVVPEPPITHVNTQVLHDKNASVVNVQLAKRTHNHFDPPEYEYKASGSAKREPGDVRDDATGELLALSRAFQDLSRQLEREAGKRVRVAAKAQQAHVERVTAKWEKARTPARHRTFEEWQEIQARAAEAQSRLTQAERNRQLAKNLGLSPVATEFFGRLSSLFSVPPFTDTPPAPRAYTPRHADGKRPDGLPE